MLSKWMTQLRLRTQFIVLLSILLCGLLFCWQKAWRTIQDVRVGGAMYQNIIDAKDLIADVLPPPAYIIESYLITLQMRDAKDEKTQQALQVRLFALKVACEASYRNWARQPLEPEIKRWFFFKANVAAQHFYDVIFLKYLYAIKTKDNTRIENVLNELASIYEEHRKAIDQVVILANKKNNAEEQHAQHVIEESNKVLIFALIIPIILAAILFIVIMKPLMLSLSHLRIKFHAMAQGNLTQDFFSYRKDEIGAIFASASFMQNALRNAEELLRKAPEELTKRVQERTYELKQSNERLELEILERKRIEQELIESREQLRMRSAHLEVIREEERKHIAMELHDELGQLLTATKMDLSLLRSRFAAKKNKESEEFFIKVGSIRDTVEKTIQVVRNVTAQLRPNVLNLGIIPALEWLAENLNQREDINCQTDFRCGEINIADPHATIIFRIVQESLTNVMRHAQASNVMISLVQEQNELDLSICDDGIGFDIGTTAKHLSHGLLGIHERAQLIKATLNVESQRGQGTRISLRIPINNVS